MAVVVEVIENTNEIEVVVSNGRGPQGLQGPPGITEWGFGGDINNQTDLIDKFDQEESDRIAGDAALQNQVDDKLDKNGLSGRFRTVDGKLIKVDEGGNASIENYIDGTYQDFNNRVVAGGGTTDEVSSKEAICEAAPEALSVISANGGSVGKIHDLVSNGFATVQRNSNATYIEDGLIKTAAPNVPRFQDGKILVEGEVTNFFRWSEDFENLNLIRTQLSAPTVVDGIEFMGLTSTETTFNDNYAYSPISPSSGNMTISALFLKSNNNVFGGLYSNYALVSVSINLNTLDVQVIFNTNNNYISHSIVDFGQYIRFSVTLSNAGDNVGLRFPSIVGDEIFATRLEVKNEEKISSYIPTNGSAATRLADVITINPPTGTKKIITTIDGVKTETTTIPATYQLPEGDVNKVEFLPEVCEDKGEPNINPDSDVKNLKFWKGTQAEFDAQSPFDDDVITFII